MSHLNSPSRKSNSCMHCIPMILLFVQSTVSSFYFVCYDIYYYTILESVLFLNPLTPMSDQDGISPYKINTESSRQVRRIKKKTKLGNYGLVQYQILQIETIGISWHTVGRITNEILGVKGLILADCHVHILRTVCTLLFDVSISRNVFS